MAINKRKILASAQKHLQKGALDKALRDYQSVLEADPRDANVRLKVGDLLLRQGQRGEAFATYLKVADQFMREGFDAKAVALYKQIAKIDPSRYEIYLPLADLYQRLGLMSEAMNALQTAADHYHREGRKGEALDLLRRMASLDPSNTTSRLKIAELLRQAGRDEEALTEYEETAAELERQGDWEAQIGVLERILELEPKRSETLTALCQVLVEQGEAERAETFAKRLLDADPGVPEAYELLASTYRHLGREEEATGVYRQLAEVYRTRGDEDKAREITQRFLPTEPLDLGALGEGEDDSLQLDLEEEADGMPSLETDPPRVEPDAPAADASAAPPEPEGETPFLEETDPSLELDEPEEVNPDQLLAEAAVYLRYGKHDRAIASLERVLSVEPDHPLALDRLAEAHAGAGSPARAIDAFVQAAAFARGRGDSGRFEALRERVQELDPRRAAEFGESPAEASVESPSQSDADATPQTSAAEEEAPADEEPADYELEAAGSEAESDGEELPDLGDIDIEIDADELDVSDADAAADAEGSESTKGSSTTPQQIVEDLEEAGFYFEQNMFAEAEAIYRRVLSVAPSHPQALLRLGEIAAAHGKDPSGSKSERAAAADAAGDITLPEESGEAEDGLDLGDELAEPAPAAATDEAPILDDESAPPETAGEEVEFEFDADEDSSPTLEGIDDEPPGQALFDLAAELSDVLDQEEETQDGVATDEDGFQAIFREFKRGVSQTLGEADHETRYDLGIAYREMGLFEDAIGEFQIAAEQSDRQPDALHMLGLCFLDLGRASDAASHLERALAVEGGAPERQAAIRFDLARAYQEFGDCARALDTFRQVAEIDPDFQGVSDRIAALESSAGSEGEPAESEEDFESFSDLIAETEEEPAEAETYETFDDVVAEVEEEADAESPPAKRRRKISFV